MNKQFMNSLLNDYNIQIVNEFELDERSLYVVLQKEDVLIVGPTTENYSTAVILAFCEMIKYLHDVLKDSIEANSDLFNQVDELMNTK